LRQRPEDIPYLAQRFMEEAGVELRRPVQRFIPAAVELLQGHAWPGNVRELRNVVRQAVLKTTELVIRPADLRGAWSAARATTAAARRSAGTSLKLVAEEAARGAERQAISEALRATGGNQSRAAKVLQTDYKTLHLKLKRLGIRARDFAP
jgi:two-component system, NtrC family, response regulator HydG